MTKKWRQRLHLEPPHGWLNDPNGLCWFNGRYHVFFQYAPNGADGSGKKCWGHYESADFLKWEFVGTALFPDIPEDRDGVYSGSAIVADGVMKLFYTGNVKESGDHDYITNGRGANVIRVSSEDGRSFSEKRVLLRNSDYPEYCSCHVRDPKVWKENGRYYMILGARTLGDEGCVLIYGSDELDKWRFEKKLAVPDFGYMWECPDMFEVDGHRLLSVSPQGLPHTEAANQNVYSSGYFHVNGDDLNGFEEWDHGFDFYAPQTFSAPDGRRILIGWMGIGDIPYTNPTVPLGWQHCLTLPREITVSKDGTVLQNPIRELERLRGEEFSVPDGESRRVPLCCELLGKANGSFEITLDNAVSLTCDGKIFRLEFKDESVGGGRKIRSCVLKKCGDIRIIADMSSLEIYLDGGRKVLSTRFYPDSESIKLQTLGISLTGCQLNSMEVDIYEE
ncbi:MAG: glycoside hydrolase family 32 protein [Oscillospiraceae bacterium]|nr:glycoside hydrolase family 32 protein [Oscillospiraceae bacterium]